MKRISYILFVFGILFQIAAFGQIPIADASITGVGPQADIGGQTTYEGVGHTGNFLINVVNLGPGTIPAGGMLVAAAVSPNLAFTNPIPSSAIPAGWEVLSADNGNVQLINTVPIPAGEIYVFSYPVKAVMEGPGTYLYDVSNLGYNDPISTNNSSPVGVTVTSVGNNPMPVTLASFTAAKEGQAVLLNWVTTEEVNSDFFKIQHSRDAKHWTALGRVESHKDSKMRNEYGYTHATPVSGLNYYRLKMVDRDGTYDYSDIKSITLEGGIGIETVKIYPNPVSTGQLTIETVGNAPVKRIEVLNSAGIRVHVAPAGKVTAHTVEVGRYPAGVYLTRVVYEDGSSSTHRVVIAN